MEDIRNKAAEDAEDKKEPMEERLIDITSAPVESLLDLLLQDKTTQKNIIWATDTYEAYGRGFAAGDPMDRTLLLQHPDMIRPRIRKSRETQTARTRQKAEVFTPAWLCCRMNNVCDEVWFGRKDVFDMGKEDHTWTPAQGPVQFPGRKTWRQFVDSRRLEITCGEAPYLVSRYDVSTGERIAPLSCRVGQLDRKLRIVNENTEDYTAWLAWAIRAVEASYGYEYQGDNLLIARINLLLTFIDVYRERWEMDPEDRLLREIADRIAWNLWQMDGLTDAVPSGRPGDAGDAGGQYLCQIFNWREGRSVTYRTQKKFFSWAVGNPPYQKEFTDEGNKTYAASVYHLLMDDVFDKAASAVLIHPARFLFDAGSTPKSWNRKMLNDSHFKVLAYREDSEAVFPDTEIKGGLAVTLHAADENFGAIRVFTKFRELNSILHKVSESPGFTGMDTIAVTRTAYHFTEQMHREHPNARYRENEKGDNIGLLSKGHDYDVSTNIFERIPEIFFEEKPDDGKSYVRILGRIHGRRVFRWIRRDYINRPVTLDTYTVDIPKANGIGKFGEALTSPVIDGPGTGSTETFLSIGAFKTEEECRNCLKYIRTKFARALLGVRKTTQDLTPAKWKYVPLQDFSPASDLPWIEPVSEIDRWLYARYHLTPEEISFIESSVEEMP